MTIVLTEHATDSPGSSSTPMAGRPDPIHILVLDGDGSSPELTAATLTVLRCAAAVFDVDFDYEMAEVGFRPLGVVGTTFPATVLDAARRADGVILGPVSHNEYPSPLEGGLNPSGQLRQHLDLYANIRPARALPGLPMRIATSAIDLVVVRENTEGFYADRSMFMGPGEFMPTPDLALSLRKVSRSSSTRIAERAFELARKRRRKITAVHKANVLRVTDGLFLDCVRQVGAAFPDVEYEEQLIDAMTALLIRDPGQFDVIVTTNMFGDILSDQATELSGSIGLGASLNAGSEHAVAQAQHGSAPSLAGRNLINPYSLISSTAMLLDWLGERLANPRLVAAGSAMEAALNATVSEPGSRTADLGGPLGTSQFAERVCVNLKALARQGAARE
jgi:3-isopropylmalate dehydrogenase